MQDEDDNDDLSEPTEEVLEADGLRVVRKDLKRKRQLFEEIDVRSDTPPWEKHR